MKKIFFIAVVGLLMLLGEGCKKSFLNIPTQGNAVTLDKFYNAGRNYDKIFPFLDIYVIQPLKKEIFEF